MLLEDLPPELIESILTLLPASSILNLGLCSRKLKNITINEHVWEKCARRDYLVDLRKTKLEVETKCTSARQFYHKVLVPFGSSLQTIWQVSNFQYYGGLAKLLYHQWALYLVALDPPAHPNYHENLQPEMITSLFLNDQNQTTTYRPDGSKRLGGIGNRLAEFISEQTGFETRVSVIGHLQSCLLYTSPSPRAATLSRMPSSA